MGAGQAPAVPGTRLTVTEVPALLKEARLLFTPLSVSVMVPPSMVSLPAPTVLVADAPA